MISTGALSSPPGIRIPHSHSRGALVRPYRNSVLKHDDSSARQSSALRLRSAHPTLSPTVLENRNKGCSTEARAGSEETIRANHDNGRRRFLLLTLPAAAIPPLVPDSSSAASAAPSLSDRLTSEIARNPGTALFGPRQLYYPDWLFGTWQVDATFESFSTPLGSDFVSPGMLREAADPQVGVGTRVSYQARFYSTLMDTWQNWVRPHATSYYRRGYECVLSLPSICIVSLYRYIVISLLINSFVFTSGCSKSPLPTPRHVCVHPIPSQPWILARPQPQPQPQPCQKPSCTLSFDALRMPSGKNSKNKHQNLPRNLPPNGCG